MLTSPWLRPLLNPLALFLFLGCWFAGSPVQAYDVLEVPAAKSRLATQTLVYSVQSFHGTVYATGQRGHILLSNDAGKTWTQAEVPVRSDLLDIYFPSPQQGWAVGHDGVILHSADAGRTWVKQYDGFRLAREGLEWYRLKQAEFPDEPFFGVLVSEFEFSMEQGADKPFFRVWFADDKHGYVLGAYGVMLQTLDGGQNWRPIMEKLMYDQFVHLYDLAPLPSGKFIVGEMGSMLRWDDTSQRYEKVESPYNGSLFTVLQPTPGRVLVAGLRGRAFYQDGPQSPWREVSKPATEAVVDSILLADGRVLMVTVDGQLLASRDQGASFRLLNYRYPRMLSGVAEVQPGRLLLVGAAGIQGLSLAPVAATKQDN